MRSLIVLVLVAVVAAAAVATQTSSQGPTEKRADGQQQPQAAQATGQAVPAGEFNRDSLHLVKSKTTIAAVSGDKQKCPVNEVYVKACNKPCAKRTCENYKLQLAAKQQPKSAAQPGHGGSPSTAAKPPAMCVCAQVDGCECVAHFYRNTTNICVPKSNC